MSLDFIRSLLDAETNVVHTVQQPRPVSPSPPRPQRAKPASAPWQRRAQSIPAQNRSRVLESNEVQQFQHQPNHHLQSRHNDRRSHQYDDSDDIEVDIDLDDDDGVADTEDDSDDDVVDESVDDKDLLAAIDSTLQDNEVPNSVNSHSEQRYLPTINEESMFDDDDESNVVSNYHIPPLSQAASQSETKPNRAVFDRYRKRRRLQSALPIIDCNYHRYRPRYLSSYGRLAHSLPLMIAVLRQSVLVGDCDSVIDWLTSLIRLRRLSADLIFKSLSSLLTITSTDNDSESIRYYRRMRTIKPVLLTKSRSNNMPLTMTKNATQVIVELSLLLYGQGQTQSAYEELTRYLTQSPFDSNHYHHGLAGVMAYHLAVDNQSQSQALSQSHSLSQSFTQASFSFSQSSMTGHGSQQSHSLRNRSKLYRREALKHLKQALTLAPQCDTWLHFHTLALTRLSDASTSTFITIDIDSDSGNDSGVDDKSLVQSFRAIHTFTVTSSDDVSGWQQKLAFLLAFAPFNCFTHSVVHASKRVLDYDPVNGSAISVLIDHYHRHRGSVSTVAMIHRVCQFLDCEPLPPSLTQCDVWQVLHSLLHQLYYHRHATPATTPTDSTNVYYVSEFEELQWHSSCGDSPEPEIVDWLLSVHQQEAEESELSQPQSQAAMELDEGDDKDALLAARRKKSKGKKRGRNNAVSVSPAAALSPMSPASHSSTPRSNSSMSSRASSLLSGSSMQSSPMSMVSDAASQSSPRVAGSMFLAPLLTSPAVTDTILSSPLTLSSPSSAGANDAASGSWSWKRDMRSRLAWWMLSDEFFAGVKATVPSTVSPDCSLTASDDRANHLSCCHGLMKAVLPNVTH